MKILMLKVLLLAFIWTTQAQDITTSTEEKLRTLENEIDVLKKLYADVAVNVLDYQHYIKKEIAAQQKKIAFSATLSKLWGTHEFIGPFEEKHTLAYKNVITNVGNAYNPSTGIFTAPLKGVYYFSFTLFHPKMWSGEEKGTGVFLLKNGAIVVGATDNVPAEDSEDTSGNSVSLLLDEGDVVALQLWEGRRVYTDGNKRNTFNGHLLFTMSTDL